MNLTNNDSRLTVKQLESKKKQLKTKLSNLLDAPKRDDVVTFEELGADSLMVDEAHNFKNLMTVTKMHNIAGISTTESQKASDLFMKCQYLDEITGARGVTFATGTPISNSMTELYTMQRYLQQYALERNINAIRAASGLSPLAMDGGLSAAADARCESFVAGGAFDHSGMTTRSEICAAGPIGSASSVCSYWQNSPAHYANITNASLTSMGVACWFCSTAEGQYTYWTVTFN